MEFRSCSWCGYIYQVQHADKCPYCGYHHNALAGKRAMTSPDEARPDSSRDARTGSPWKAVLTVA